MDNLYEEDSIEHVSPLQFTRMKPHVYIGSTKNTNQLIIEFISNAIDEVKLGHGNRIDFDYKQGVYTIRDYGQGIIPSSIQPNGKTILENAFSELNTSAKLRNDGTYQGLSLGNFGIGAKLGVYLSHWAEITTFKDGLFEKVRFVEGIFSEREEGKNIIPTLNGVEVKYKPSEEFFTTCEIDKSFVRKYFKQLTCLCFNEKLEIHLNIEGDTEIFKSKNGIGDLLEKREEIINKRFDINKSDEVNKVELVFTYTTAYESTIIPYMNTGLTRDGVHLTSIKNFLTKQMNNYFRTRKWLKEKDQNFSNSDILEGLYLVFNITTKNIKYNAQVKSTVEEVDLKPIYALIEPELTKWFKKNSTQMKKIFEKVNAARKTREAVKKAKDLSRKKKTKPKVLNLPTKLVDCTSKIREKCKLFIVEGDSAGGGLVQGRDPIYEAVYSLRGKLLNLLKASNNKILANQEVQGLIKALGLEVNQHGKLIYDKNVLRYGKIIIATDADPDGSHIRLLIVTALWRLCPDLILNGHLYTVHPPLFRVTLLSKNKYIYLDNDNELEKWKRENSNVKFQVSRFKGLKNKLALIYFSVYQRGTYQNMC